MLAGQKEVTLEQDNWFSGCNRCPLFLFSSRIVYFRVLHFTVTVKNVMFSYLQFCPSDPTKLMVSSADSQVRILHGIDVIGKVQGESLCFALMLWMSLISGIEFDLRWLFKKKKRIQP